MENRIYLVGFMGVGKSTIGKRLSKALDYNFFDMDTVFEKKYKINIDLFFHKYNEKVFRKLEREILTQTFDLDNTVISTGGGTVLNGGIDEINKHGLSIYLFMEPVAIASRLLKAKRQRPLIKGKTGNELLDFINMKLSERSYLYEKADITYNALNPDVNELVSLIKNYQ